MTMVAVLAGVGVLMAIVLGLMAKHSFVAVPSGHVLIINRLNRIEVSSNNAMVLPIVHRAELMDVSVRTLKIECQGRHGLSCRDDIRADLRAVFSVRVGTSVEDILKVAARVGCARATEVTTIDEIFRGRFTEALESVAKEVSFEQLASQREEFRDQVVEQIGSDLQGYVLDDVAIESLGQTPIEQLDPNHIMDARGIRTITESTTAHRIATHEAERDAELRIARLDSEIKLHLLQLRQRRDDALHRFREETGRGLTEEELEAEVSERLRALMTEIMELRERQLPSSQSTIPAS